MFFKIQKSTKGVPVYLFSEWAQLMQTGLQKSEAEALFKQTKTGQNIFNFKTPERNLYFIFLKETEDSNKQFEQLRKTGATLLKNHLRPASTSEIMLFDLTGNQRQTYHLAEGITLAAYQFLKYKSEHKKLVGQLNQINFDKSSITLKQVRQLKVITDAVKLARDLVNEPVNYLTAEQLAKEIADLGKESGFRVQTLSKAKIEQLGMGGILGVSKGSLRPPTFTIMEHKPMNPVRKAPVVLIGKGIVYDTGGLSLKPTANSMDKMKSDMSGAAVVTAAMYIAAMLELPIHLIALVPATENRPGVDAYVPGDVLKMYSGTTVEVLNTDAEGRLVLADALHYAKKYRPELVLDFATLTGSASATLGDQGIIYMGNAPQDTQALFEVCGQRQHERLAKLPLWDEYADLLRSDIADMKNIGGPKAGAITAGKFLEHFTDFPWIHFDIAGVSFHSEHKDYRPAGATGYGIRLLADFLIHYCGAE